MPHGVNPTSQKPTESIRAKGPSHSLRSEAFPFSSPDSHTLIFPPPPPPEPHLQPRPASEPQSLPPSAQGSTLQEAPRSPPVSSSQRDRKDPPHASPTPHPGWLASHPAVRAGSYPDTLMPASHGARPSAVSHPPDSNPKLRSQPPLSRLSSTAGTGRLSTHAPDFGVSSASETSTPTTVPHCPSTWSLLTSPRSPLLPPSLSSPIIPNGLRVPNQISRCLKPRAFRYVFQTPGMPFLPPLGPFLRSQGPNT